MHKSFTMNWTGGRLQQSKRSAHTSSAKQKAYFAKARAKLQSGPGTISPLRVLDSYNKSIQFPLDLIRSLRLPEQHFAG